MDRVVSDGRVGIRSMPSLASISETGGRGASSPWFGTIAADGLVG